MSTKYDQIVDDVPFTLDVGVRHLLACCDCGLVHDVRFLVDQANGEPVVILEFHRNKRKTKANRKKNFKGLVLPPETKD